MMTGEPTQAASKGLHAQVHPVYQHHLESKVAITLCYQLYSTCFQPVRIEKYLKSNCVIKVASMKNAAVLKMKPSRTATNLTFFAVSEDE